MDTASRQRDATTSIAPITVYTIGFAGRTAEQFFGTLRQHGIRRIVDVRLNNVGQLAGFTKREDLRFFLRELCQAEYHHERLLAPTKEILSDYRRNRSWAEYTERYLRLLDERHVGEVLSQDLLTGPAALLCSEPAPDRCHRRLAIEHLAEKWGGIIVKHL